MNLEPRERREVYFSGRVQGVGFRYTARQIAERFDVVGFARNLPDGRVQLVAEGEQQEIERYLAALWAEMDRYIGHVEQHAAPATGEFTDFHVRH